MFDKKDISRDGFMLVGGLAKCGYDWWWHSFTAHNERNGEEKSFFIEFFLCNPKLGKDEPVFGQLPESIKDGIKRNSGSFKWNLNIKKIIPFNVGYGAGKVLRNLQVFEMFWHAEGMKTEYSGEVILDGEKYVVNPENCYGYADKNWGKNFTSPWVWLSSNNLKSLKTGKVLENSVFDIGGGCPKVGPIKLKRKLLSAFFYEGKRFEFNFSKFWTFTRTKFKCQELENQIVWHVEQKTWMNKMVTDITCEKRDMLFVNYEAPNGEKRHNRLWNGGNGKGTIKLYRHNRLVDEIYADNVGCEYGEFDNLK